MGEITTVGKKKKVGWFILDGTVQDMREVSKVLMELEQRLPDYEFVVTNQKIEAIDKDELITLLETLIVSGEIGRLG